MAQKKVSNSASSAQRNQPLCVNTMHRKLAIKQIAQHSVGKMPMNARNTIVECEFLSDYEVGDKEIQHYPVALREELCAGNQLLDSSDSRYNPIIMDELVRSYMGAKNEFILKKLEEIIPGQMTIEGEPELLLDCPCCHYLTLSERGDYEICVVCYWEDDGASKDDHYSGPNHQTLKQGRDNFIRFGACDEKAKEHVEPEGIHKYHRMNPRQNK